MQQYSLGVVFDGSLEHVLLMHKTRPASQAGKVNGLGGKVESGEDSRTCVVREIKEESGLITVPADWVYAGAMRSDEWTIDVYGLVYTGSNSDTKSIEEQRVEWFPVDALPQNGMSNLAWLVPFVRNKLLDKDTMPRFLIEYS